MSEIKNDLEIFNTIVDHLLKDEENGPVTSRIPIAELDEKFDIALSEKSISDDDFSKALENIILGSPKTSTNKFFNQLFGGRQGKAIIGELLAVMLNNSMYTYKVGGPQVAIEKEIITQLCKMINYGPKSGGTFAAGGSMSNYMAMVIARDVYDKNAKNKGVSRPLIAYTSQESHYSISKNASFSGIGRDQIRYIVSDPETGKINPQELKIQIKKDLTNGNVPFFVNLTAGTTVLGAFDDINPVADICEEFDVWLHIDGALGGSSIFSEKYNQLLTGLERSNSFSINAHKMLGTPLACSMVLVKDKNLLYNSFTNDAEYLYQGDRDDYNLGKTSFQCGRRNDALKFWTLWKSIGTKGLSSLVDHEYFLADVARKYVRSHPDYQLFSFDDSISICFNYKNIDAKELCTSLYNHSKLMVGYGKFKNVEFIRLVTINANNREEDILNFFKDLEEHVAMHYS